ncbi:phage tail sheath family protein [Zoogloea sp.]|uniref:phage tail sheath family protein n=1 Tax=Zoogloea sp. TaxID=49181 RepID=UPI0035B333AF
MTVALLGSLWRPGLPPGIYEERPAVATRSRVRLDVAALIGLAERGPVNTPVVIDDARQFEAIFGRALPGLQLPLAVRLFFANGGRRCVAVRCVDHVNVRTARLLLPGVKAVRGSSRRQARLAARNPGSWGNRLQVRAQLIQRPVALGFDPVTHAIRIPPDRPAVGATLRLTGRPTSPGAAPRSRCFRVALDATRQPILVPTPTAPFLDAELLTAAVELSLRLDVYLDGRRVETWDDAALHPSHPRFLPRLLGRRAASEALLPPRTDTPDPDAPSAEPDRLWGNADEPWGSDYLRPSALLADAWLLPTKALLAAPTGILLTAAEMPASRHGRDATASTGRQHFFESTAMALDDLVEDSDHRFVAFNARPPALDALAVWDQAHPFEPVALVALPDLLHPTPPEALSLPPALPDELCFGAQCSRGKADTTASALHYPLLGFDADELQACQLALIRHCEALDARLALLDLPPGLRAGDIVQWRHALASPRAALYTPWLRVDADGTAATVPPAGAACGIAAQVENDTGVWGAPANRKVQGAFARADDAGLPDPGFLFEERIDEIRRTERGLMLLGARTTATDRDWTHIPVRRLIDWLKAQLAADLAWAPFEPNDAVLWSAMAGTARRRLKALFNAGALAGRTDTDSYFIRCDASTHTQGDLDAGRAIMQVGVAPAVPAEFIVFRLVRSGADAPRIEVI